EAEWPQSGCPVIAMTVELDDQPGPLRDDFLERLESARERVIGELRALRTPPLSAAEARAVYFQMRSFVLGHSEARRMMGDADAPKSAFAAFHALLDRTAAKAA